jgi:hypothetical protein
LAPQLPDVLLAKLIPLRPWHFFVKLQDIKKLWRKSDQMSIRGNFVCVRLQPRNDSVPKIEGRNIRPSISVAASLAHFPRSRRMAHLILPTVLTRSQRHSLTLHDGRRNSIRRFMLYS